MERFLLGYHRDKQFDQPVYLEVLIEKNTLLNITRPVCREYYVPVTSGRGFAGPSVWYRMANRFAASKKERMVLLVVSDYDPEGLALARDAIRSLRDLWEIPIDYHRVALTREQIDDDELGLTRTSIRREGTAPVTGKHSSRKPAATTPGSARRLTPNTCGNSCGERSRPT